MTNTEQLQQMLEAMEAPSMSGYRVNPKCAKYVIATVAKMLEAQKHFANALFHNDELQIAVGERLLSEALTEIRKYSSQ